MLAIIDYKMGNLCSVENALRRLGADYTLTADPAVIARASRVLLPGVGHFAQAMHHLREAQLDTLIPTLRKPVLGICVGLQVLCRDSEEAEHGAPLCEGIGLFDSHIRRFPTHNAEAKVPHMGWNTIENLEKKIFKNIDEGSHVYYVHSFYPTLCSDTIGTTRHGDTLFSAALQYENFYATQFHPEKSGDVGEKILENFLHM